MNIILSKPSETIKLIKIESGIPTYIKRSLPRIETLIRWGSVREASAKKTYNSIEAIRLSSNKLKCRQLLYEAGVPVPKLGSELFPCIGRPLYHSSGEGFWLCRTLEEVLKAKQEGAKYFSQYYPKTSEFRVHIGSGKVLLYSEKVGDKFGTVIWNHQSGFEFKHKERGERRLDIINLAKQAVEVIGLDFAAVDILADPMYEGFPQAVVCEVNTAPALSEYGIAKYSEYFQNLL